MKSTINYILVGLFFLAVFPYLFLHGNLAMAITIGINTFSGKIEKVDTGCFADGECYVVVGGNHVVLNVGWNKEPVGKIIGEDSIGGLEKHIGQNATVYARRLSYSKFSLIGSMDYYIKIDEKN